MKHQFKLCAVLLVAVMLTATSAFAYEIALSNTNSEKTALLFDESATVLDIAEIIDENQILVDSFTTVIPNGSSEITCGFVVRETDEFSNLWDEFIKQQTALLSDAMVANAGNAKILEDILATKHALENGNIQITEIVCDGDIKTKNIDSAGMNLIQKVEKVEMCTEEAMPPQKSEIGAQAAASNWLPTSGSAFVWPSGSYDDATYLQVNYEWDSSSKLSTLTNNTASTLEGEIVLRNYDGEAIANRWNTNYAYTTNQPRAYRDTQFLDGSDECCFTVGCSDASALEAGKQYYWYAYGNRTESESCDVKVYFQRGHRLPAGIYDTAWNVFADETKIVIRFSDWNTADASSMEF